MRGLMLGTGLVSLLLTACAVNRDTRTEAEKDRDAEIWTHALSLPVVTTTAGDQLAECKKLGDVSEHYYEDVPSDPMKRTARMAWPEHMLRFKTVQLGGNAAVMNTPIDKWKPDDLVQSRVLGEAWRCHQPTIATR